MPGADASKISVEDLDKAIQALPAEKQAWIKSEFNRGGVNAALTALASVQDKTVTIYTAFSEANRAAYNPVPRRAVLMVAPCLGPARRRLTQSRCVCLMGSLCCGRGRHARSATTGWR